ncbi:hypothetical protein UB46_25330 [Burkholderiaceae bacterium 16]|nr:hypothetical protein UB46_25330 [Burkholderiaceae bacterium 16]
MANNVPTGLPRPEHGLFNAGVIAEDRGIGHEPIVSIYSIREMIGGLVKANASKPAKSRQRQ